MYRIEDLETLEEMMSYYHIITELHPHITPDDYHKKLSHMLKNGYRQVGIFDKQECAGIAGYWINTRLYCGKYIDIDNVIIRKDYRSKGIGKLLMNRLEEIGREEGCEHAVLDAYVENARAHRFYFERGYIVRGFHFLKKL